MGTKWSMDLNLRGQLLVSLFLYVRAHAQGVAGIIESKQRLFPDPGLHFAPIKDGHVTTWEERGVK